MPLEKAVEYVEWTAEGLGNLRKTQALGYSTLSISRLSTSIRAQIDMVLDIFARDRNWEIRGTTENDMH
jgi:hypothetical protein